MNGWELLFRVSENPNGFGSALGQGRGMLLEVTSDELAYNQQTREREDRMRRGRFIDSDAFTVDEAEPGGGLGFVPRSNDILGFLMAHFQCVRYEAVGTVHLGFGTGTFTFIPIAEAPDWAGTVWGSSGDGVVATTADIFSINVERIYGQDLETGQFVQNGLKIENAVVTELEFSQRLGEDLMVTPRMEGKSGDPSAAFGAAYFPEENAIGGSLGSFSALSMFTDWQGTVQYSRGGTGTTLEVQEITYTFENGQEGRRRLGTKNRVRFPFSGRPSHTGELQWEFDRTDVLDDMVNKGSVAIKTRWYEGALNWLEIDQPHCHLLPADAQGAGGDSAVMFTQPFRAFPNSGTPASFVRVCTVFATKVWTFPFGEGTYDPD